MSDIKLTVGNTDICSMDFVKELEGMGKKLKMNLETGYRIAVSPDKTQAAVFTRVIAKDTETDYLHLKAEFVTVLKSSEPIENFDPLIRDQYIPLIMTKTSEKMNTISKFVGMNIAIPAAPFTLGS